MTNSFMDRVKIYHQRPQRTVSPIEIEMAEKLKAIDEIKPYKNPEIGDYYEKGYNEAMRQVKAILNETKE